MTFVKDLHIARTRDDYAEYNEDMAKRDGKKRRTHSHKTKKRLEAKRVMLAKKTKKA